MSDLSRVELRGDTIVRVGHNDIKCPLKGNSQSLRQSLYKVNVVLGIVVKGVYSDFASRDCKLKNWGIWENRCNSVRLG